MAAFCVPRDQRGRRSEWEALIYQCKQVSPQVSLPRGATLDAQMKTVSTNSCLTLNFPSVKAEGTVNFGGKGMRLKDKVGNVMDRRAFSLP